MTNIELLIQENGEIWLASITMTNLTIANLSEEKNYSFPKMSKIDGTKRTLTAMFKLFLSVSNYKVYG